MQTATETPSAAPRFDMYQPIHKALRAFMSDTLVAVGRMDTEDESDVVVTLAQTRSLLAVMKIHLDDENRFVHTAMEARAPGSAGRTGRDHVEHECALGELGRLVESVAHASAAERAAVALELYRELAKFVAENLEHMNVEERDNTAVLWEHYTDEELRAIEARILGSVPPEAMAVAMRWMIPALNHAERVQTLRGMRQGMPKEAFEGVVAIACSHLAPRDWTKLEKALALPAARAA